MCPLKHAEGVVCLCASVSLAVMTVRRRGKRREEWERRQRKEQMRAGGEKRDSEAVVREELELENCSRREVSVSVCVCGLSLNLYRSG